MKNKVNRSAQYAMKLYFNDHSGEFDEYWKRYFVTQVNCVFELIARGNSVAYVAKFMKCPEEFVKMVESAYRIHIEEERQEYTKCNRMLRRITGR